MTDRAGLITNLRNANNAAMTRLTRYVVDRDGDLWRSDGGQWLCVTAESVPVAGGDLVNVLGPLLELGVEQRGVVEANEAGAVWTGKTITPARVP